MAAKFTHERRRGREHVTCGGQVHAQANDQSTLRDDTQAESSLLIAHRGPVVPFCSCATSQGPLSDLPELPRMGKSLDQKLTFQAIANLFSKQTVSLKEASMVMVVMWKALRYTITCAASTQLASKCCFLICLVRPCLIGCKVGPARPH